VVVVWGVGRERGQRSVNRQKVKRRSAKTRVSKPQKKCRGIQNIMRTVIKDILVHVLCAGEGSRQIREISPPRKGTGKTPKKRKANVDSC